MLISPLSPQTVNWLIWAIRTLRRVDGRGTGNDVSSLLSGDGIRRIGSSVVFGTPDGSQRVLAFIDAVPDKLRSLEASQQAIGASLTSLQTLSAVSLGVSALTPAVMGLQFAWLRRQFNDLKKQIKNLEDLVEGQTRAKLKTGLDALEAGTRKNCKRRIEHAYVPCREAMHSFADRLGSFLEEPEKQQDRKVIRHLTQHLSVAICAAARCDIATGDDDGAEETITRHQPVLVKSSQAVFRQTLENGPGRFLTANLTDDNSGIEFLRSLIQQAKDTGILASDHPLAQASGSVAEFVNHLLGAPRRNGFLGSWFGPDIKDELRDAAASVEDASRVLSLRSMIEEAKRVGRDVRSILGDVEAGKKAAKSPFVAWAI